MKEPGNEVAQPHTLLSPLRNPPLPFSKPYEPAILTASSYSNIKMADGSDSARKKKEKRLKRHSEEGGDGINETRTFIREKCLVYDSLQTPMITNVPMIQVKR